MEKPHREPRGFHYIVLLVLSAAGVLLATNQVFTLKLGGFLPIDAGYLYFLIGAYLPIVFLTFRARPPAGSPVPWYDWIFAALSCAIPSYLGATALKWIVGGWEAGAPLGIVIIGTLLCLLVLEATRRTTGLMISLICLFFGLYPLVANYMPGPLWGVQFNFSALISRHVTGMESILGLPMQAFGTIVIGFMIFGVVMQHTGGGKFFVNLALASLGRATGGPAKVAVLASGLFGTMSGSAISNVMSIGTVTIPTMKQGGYPPEFAAAVEACSSTGGPITPPVMGAVAFIMAYFLGVPYWTICVAAFFPAFLYYLGMYCQIDGYSVRNGLRGLSESELPPLSTTLKDGWHFAIGFIILIWLLVVLKVEAWAPFYASAALLVLAMLRKSTRLSPRSFLTLIANSGKSLAELIAILAAIGFVVGSLSMTGVAHALSRELTGLGGGNPALLLAMGGIAAFVLGMGMPISAVYIFLAISVAPALAGVGIQPIVAHFFILYWANVSFITPPVALATIAAASLAGSNIWTAGIRSLRLGVIMLLLPFFIVFNPAIVAQGSILRIIYTVVSASIGTAVLCYALEGCLPRIGEVSLARRLVLIVGGVLMVAPRYEINAIGLAAIAVIIGLTIWKRRQSTHGQLTTTQ